MIGEPTEQERIHNEKVAASIVLARKAKRHWWTALLPCKHYHISWMPGDEMRKFCMDCGEIFGDTRGPGHSVLKENVS